MNALRVLPGRGIRVYGARTLSSDPQERFLNVRRLLAAIEKTVHRGMQWAVFEQADEQLRALMRLGLTELLAAYWAEGALVGARQEEAFFVRCDDRNNPPEEVANGWLTVDVGVAPTVPSEFVLVRVGRQHEVLVPSELPAAGAR